MSKHRPDPLLLFYLPTREESEIVFNALVAIDDAIKEAKNVRQARVRLRELLKAPNQTQQTKEFIERIIELRKDRMERYAQSALRRLFTSTHHYQSALTNRTSKARAKNKQKENPTP